MTYKIMIKNTDAKLKSLWELLGIKITVMISLATDRQSRKSCFIWLEWLFFIIYVFSLIGSEQQTPNL